MAYLLSELYLWIHTQLVCQLHQLTVEHWVSLKIMALTVKALSGHSCGTSSPHMIPREHHVHRITICWSCPAQMTSAYLVLNRVRAFSAWVWWNKLSDEIKILQDLHQFHRPCKMKLFCQTSDCDGRYPLTIGLPCPYSMPDFIQLVPGACWVALQVSHLDSALWSCYRNLINHLCFVRLDFDG